MVTIPQHGSNGELFDISAFLPHIDGFARPDTWLIKIEQCLGDKADEIEQLSLSGLSLPDSTFRLLYHGIYQTIDGHFTGMSDGEPVFELLAVDSSYWEVTGSPFFESHMLATYGIWKRT